MRQNDKSFTAAEARLLDELECQYRAFAVTVFFLTGICPSLEEYDKARRSVATE